MKERVLSTVNQANYRMGDAELLTRTGYAILDKLPGTPAQSVAGLAIAGIVATYIQFKENRREEQEIIGDDLTDEALRDSTDQPPNGQIE